MATITVGDLIEQLRGYDPNHEVMFSGGQLEFYRLKQRGPKLVQVEFNQNVWREDNGTWHVDAAD